MSNEEIRITNAEWLIMDCLWEKAPLPLKGIISCLKEQVDWSYKTYDAFLRKLVHKGAVDFHLQDGNRQYFPVITRQQAIDTETDSYLDKLFGGRAELMMANFVQQKRLSQEDKEKLIDLLNKD